MPLPFFNSIAICTMVDIMVRYCPSCPAQFCDRFLRITASCLDSWNAASSRAPECLRRRSAHVGSDLWPPITVGCLDIWGPMPCKRKRKKDPERQGSVHGYSTLCSMHDALASPSTYGVSTVIQSGLSHLVKAAMHGFGGEDIRRKW